MESFIRSRLRIASALATLIFCSAAAATSGVLPPSREQNGIWYVSGGFGCHEAAAMRKAAADFPLALSFYARGAQRRLYLAKVHVAIRDAADALVFALEAQGPILLVRLPAGHYRIDAEYKGEQRSETDHDFNVSDLAQRAHGVDPRRPARGPEAGEHPGG